MWEVTKSFRFEAAHTLTGTTLGAAAEEMHGHSYRAEITVRGRPDPATGMVIDFGVLTQILERTRKTLDHKLLNRIASLTPPTLENLARYIWTQIHAAPGLGTAYIVKVSVYRDSCGESCTYNGPGAPE